MDIQEMHISLKLELDKSDSLNNISFEPEELDYWINKAIRLFVKTKYSGSNYQRQAFEQTQKRIDDLRTLVVLESIDSFPVSDGLPNSYNALLPVDYMLTLGEQVEIVYNPYEANINVIVSSGDLVLGNYYMVINGDITHNAVSYSSSDIFIAQNNSYSEDTEGAYVILMEKQISTITQITTDTYNTYINNPFSEHRLYYYYAKPLRLFRDNYAVLITDGSYSITKYILTYLRHSEEVDIVGDISCDLPEHAHDEIISIAANLMVENIESPRIQTRAAVSIIE